MNVKDVKQRRIVVELDKPRTLWFNLNAFALLEEEFGSVAAAIQQIQEEKFTAIRYFLWAGLSEDDPALTVRDVGRLLDTTNLERVMNAVAEAMLEQGPQEVTTGKTPSSSRSRKSSV